MRHAVMILCAVVLASACAQPSADLVLLGGNVLTVDGTDRVVQAVAITGDLIVAVGTDDEIRRFIGSSTEQVALHGATVTPGLLDAHAHFASGALDRRFVVDLSYPQVKSVEDIVAIIASEVASRQPGEWITGRGWDEGKLAELRYVYAADLDAAAPDNPVWLVHTMGDGRVRGHPRGAQVLHHLGRSADDRVHAGGFGGQRAMINIVSSVAPAKSNFHTEAFFPSPLTAGRVHTRIAAQALMDAYCGGMLALE